MTDYLVIENKSENNYILQYRTDKENYIFLISGDSRIIKFWGGEIECKISSLNYQIRDFSFVGKVPGKYVLESTDLSGLDILSDSNSKKKIHLKFPENPINRIQTTLIESRSTKILNIKDNIFKNSLNSTDYSNSCVYLLNNTKITISARVSSPYPQECNYREIKSGDIYIWKKQFKDISTTFQMQIDTNNKDENETIYLIRTGYLYEFNDLFFLTYFDKVCVPISKDDFNDLLSENLIDTNLMEDTSYGKLPILSSQRVYSKELVAKYSSIKENNVIIWNKSQHFHVDVRVRVRTLGSDDFFCVKMNQKRIWRRSAGKYLAEFLDTSHNSKRFYLDTGNEYEYRNDVVFNKTLNCPAEQISDLFNHITYITKFDKILGGFKRIDIVFENNSKFEVKNKNFSIPYYNNIFPQKLYVKGQKFTDITFAPNRNQILARDNITGQNIKPHFPHLPPGDIRLGKVEFFRPEKIFKGKPYKLFQDEIECQDVKQGILGNCYLMSIIAALSERHDLIKSIFKTQTINEDGFYEIYFYDVDGTKKIMFIDDLFPYVDFDGDGKQEYIGTIPNGEEIWVMLLEKAYAKYEGGWANLEGGTITAELKFFTGCNCKDLKLDSHSAWEELLNACRRDNLVCCRSKKGSGSHSNTSNHNIANAHAYSILEADEYKGIRLIKIRNPWGELEWDGDFSDNSPLWTSELRNYFNFIQESKDDGIFCMKFEDFSKEFTNVVICYC